MVSESLNTRQYDETLVIVIRQYHGLVTKQPSLLLTHIAPENLLCKVYTNDMYVRARNTWISSTIDKANSAYTRIGTLENKFNSGAAGNKMGTWVKVGTSSACSGRGIAHANGNTDPYGSCVVGSLTYWLKSSGGQNGGSCTTTQFECK